MLLVELGPSGCILSRVEDGSKQDLLMKQLCGACLCTMRNKGG